MAKVGSSSNYRANSKYVCNKCRKSFQLFCMYACYHGHYLCRTCYEKVQSGNQYINQPELEACENDKEVRYHCYLTPRSSFLGHDGNLCETSQRTRTMFPNPGAYQHNTIDKHDSLISLATVCRPSLFQITSLSKKPINCPQYDCRKTVAVSKLDAHFHHEHKQVATIVTQLETRNCLEFHFKELRGKIKNRCLVLFTLEPILDKLARGDEDNSIVQSRSSRVSQCNPRPFFILIAAKMPSETITNTSDSNEYQFGPHERVFFYVISNVLGNYSYTIAVSTPAQGDRIKYFGPLLSANEDCAKLCQDGKGLILNHYCINRMSNDGCTPVNLDLILHERDDHSISGRVTENTRSD